MQLAIYPLCGHDLAKFKPYNPSLGVMAAQIYRYFFKTKARLLVLLALFCCVLLPCAVWAVDYAPSGLAVKAVRLGEHQTPQGAETRFVLDLNAKADYQVFTLENPYRVVIDLPLLRWEILPGSGQQSRGIIRNFRYGIFEGNRFRIVLDVAAPPRVAGVKFIAPSAQTGMNHHRLVLDIARQETPFKTFQTGNLTPPPDLVGAEKNTAPEPPLAAPDASENRKKVIVIDPGHGGVDPGAIGVRKTYEKTVTLQIAKELAKELSKNKDYKIVLTRSDDRFIKLSDRAKRARQENADIFLSLHADSHPKKTVRGASVYTLSENASDSEAERLAEQENKSDIIAGYDLAGERDDVSSILINLAQQETMQLSGYFAKNLVEHMQKSAAVLENPLRSAGFAVLKSPDVPSVLIEMGYLSNAEDEKLLLDADYRRKLIKAIADAVDAYFKDQGLYLPYGALP